MAPLKGDVAAMSLRARTAPNADRAVLYHGDALAILRDLPEESVDAVITDPPYSSGGLFASERQRDPEAKYVQTGQKLRRPSFLGDNRDQRSFLRWCTLWLGECLRVARKGAPIVVFTDWRQLPTVTDAIQAGGWIWRGIVPWDKTAGSRPRIGGFRAQCEYAVWGSNGPLPRRREIGALPGLVTGISRQEDKVHIAGKPTPIMRTLVRVCDHDGVVLDPFMGSGTTGVAALLEGRRFIGIEQDPVWHESAQKRLMETHIEAAGR